jgi:hypothetical protein
MRVVVALALIASAMGAQAPKHPAAHDTNQIKGSGKLPDGWNGRLDEPDQKLTAVDVTEEKGTLTFTTGPAGIYYKPGMNAQGNFQVTATFSQLKPLANPEGYGLFVGGVDLQKDTQRYTYFLIRQDGRFLIKLRNGAATSTLVDWKDAVPMKEAKGEIKRSNTLSIRALGDTVRFLIDDAEVHHATRAAANADGIAGIRVNHNLNVQVTSPVLKKEEGKR